MALIPVAMMTKMRLHNGARAITVARALRDAVIRIKAELRQKNLLLG
jgi:hypothetical protein